LRFSTGSACTTGKEEPSHVLAAMGFKAAEAHRVLRFSSGWETSEADWAALADGLAKSPRRIASRQVVNEPNDFYRRDGREPQRVAGKAIPFFPG